ncbi:cbb3-type cytochrome oxidase assembly protein CcoS [Rhizobium sp. NXC24]|uniref:cbb3-type cytochrome oxidase assembly protein CcoS n=1 Tax=Rhizobium sp. NXC24 TaxID=2048897 RepID=UPI000CDF2E3A|nr:cbb3-type cytochrome-c oxidase maturation nitrogen fixation FixS protein [Rhizobium sp. NXC24]
MNMLIYLIPLALFMGTLGLGGFLWSLRSGQYDDLEGASWRILVNEDNAPEGAQQTTSVSADDPTKLQNSQMPGIHRRSNTMTLLRNDDSKPG